MDDSDLIELRGMALTAVVGVLPEERERAQPIEIDLELRIDLSRAGVSDSLEDTVDYGLVCDRVAAVATAARPQLLERLATLLADEVLGCDNRIDAVSVAVRKMRPPVAHALESSGVRVVRRSGQER
ncbi:MAG: dihydroneopterin aldolase [Actinomycetia bacterium]|nr:dihydroneopterin aldolase [Actinomycetes bacterium]